MDRPTELAHDFSHLAHCSRLNVIKVLSENGPLMERTELNGHVDISVNALTQHMTRLIYANIVLKTCKRGHTYYGLTERGQKLYAGVAEFTNTQAPAQAPLGTQAP